jgi:soluble lytic murein transglycosylase
MQVRRGPVTRIFILTFWGAVVVGILILGIRYGYRELRRSHQFDSEIAAAAARYRIDPALVKAVIWRESNFNPRAKGTSGEIGLMQIREEAAFEWADAERLDNFEHSQLWDHNRNIHAGTWYLSRLLRRYTNTDNPLPYALADYNAGRTHVLRWNKGAGATNSEVFLAQVDYPGTRKYARSVMGRYEHYRAKPVAKN